MSLDARTNSEAYSLDRERGASAILIAIMMLLFMGLAALAIDVGAGFNERRQDQSAADVGALAAVQFAKPNAGCSGAACVAQAEANGAAEAIATATASLDPETAAVTDWTDASRCDTPPAGFTATATSPCVAFETGLRRAWVRVPTVAEPTIFFRVFGVQSFSVSAEAIADAGFSNPGQVLPFLLPGNAAGSDYNCLKTGPNPNWGACEDLPSTGNFGSMDFFLYENPLAGTTVVCSGGTNSRLVSNIARGINHPLGIHPTGVGTGIEEPAACPIFSAEPDMAQGQPGVGSNLEDGMLYGGSAHSTTGPYPGRIQDSGGFLVRNAGGSKAAARIDNTTLWSFLKTGLGGLCNNTLVDTPAEMIACISSAKSTGTEIFENDIALSSRFGFTPDVWELTFLTPGQYYHIKGYRPVYIDTTYYGCNAGGCDVVHTTGVADSGPCPGVEEFITCGTPGAHNKNLQAVTAYVLDSSILPPAAKEPGPGSAAQRFFNLSD